MPRGHKIAQIANQVNQISWSTAALGNRRPVTLRSAARLEMPPYWLLAIVEAAPAGKIASRQCVSGWRLKKLVASPGEK
jgi:hypothetical protein